LIKTKSKDHDKLVAGIIQRLSEADSPDDIIMDICQKTGCSWPEAEGLVNRVREEQAVKITQKQMPWLMGVALFFFVAGLLLTGYGVYGFVAAVVAQHGEMVPHDITWYFMPILEKGIDPASAFQPAIYPYFMLVVGVLFSPFSALVSGIAMIFGSLFGMREAWSTLLNRE
jgi:hypothetical protein